MAVGMVVTGMGLIGGCYMLNPTGGIDLLPDITPIFGNLDEAGAMTMLLLALSYWGFDVTRVGAMLGAWSQGRKALPPGTGEGGGKPGG
jgi:hypothetical protein